MDKSGMLSLTAKVLDFDLWGRVLLSAVRLASSANLFESHSTTVPTHPVASVNFSRRHQLADSGVDQMGQ
jgi:hypothetical protein